MHYRAILFCLWASIMIVQNASGLEKISFSMDKTGAVRVEDLVFKNLSEYFHSDYFKQTGKRCLVKRSPQGKASDVGQAAQADCSLAKTVIQKEYWPVSIVLTIPVVFHVIYKEDGTGNITDQQIRDQIEVLNEDYRALRGTLGQKGYDTRIQFKLAGITRTANETWFSDQNEMEYKEALAWDQTRYMNVYTNSASGYLGYAYLPQESAGTTEDGIVLLYQAVSGRNSGFNPYDQGRTLVHEAGHYLGLHHPFEGYGCFDGYEAGDLIADTNSEDDEHYGCVQTNSCDTPDNIHNYMDYTDDACMYEFTREQANRAVCSLMNYRPALYEQTVQFLVMPGVILILEQ